MQWLWAAGVPRCAVITASDCLTPADSPPLLTRLHIMSLPLPKPKPTPPHAPLHPAVLAQSPVAAVGRSRTAHPV